MPRSKFLFALALVVSALLIAATAGCSGSKTASTGSAESTGTVEATAAPAPSAELGWHIYLTGVGWNGRGILSAGSQSAQGALLMGGGGCAGCHGRYGKGGTARTMMGAPIDAPNITYASLRKAGFTDNTIRGAIVWRTDEARQKLAETMPAWQMSDVDLESTLAYIKTLK